jgi:hypothetical protein
MVSAGSIRRKGDESAVGRPSRILTIERFGSQFARFTTVNRDREDRESTTDPARVNYPIPSWRPFR